MYLKFFRLNRLPFALSPDPAFLFLGSGHRSLLNQLRTAVSDGAGIVVATGERGVGKTLVLESLLAEPATGTAVARVDFPPPSLADLAQAIAKQLDLPMDADRLPKTAEDLARTLANACSRRQRIVLCFDNAQLLADGVLSALRAATARTAPADLRVLLTGRPAAAERVGDAATRLTLPPLQAEELPPYVEHRLAVAGWSGPRIFHDDTYTEIARQSRGNPRIVNALCDAALSIACERELKQVRLPEIQRAMEDVGRLYSTDPADPVPAAAPAQDSQAASSAATGSVALARLRLLYKGVPILERELVRGRLQIGRAPDSDLQIESHFVSRHHCQVVTGEEHSIIEDVKSTNGLYVNDKRVRYHRLNDGDVALIGEHELRYEDLRRRH